MRAAWDLDIGVPKSTLSRAEALALSVGYQPAQQNAQSGRFYAADPKLRADVEAEHYELGFLVRRLQVTNLSSETIAALRDEVWTHKYWFDINSDAPCCYASVDIHHALSLDIPLAELLSHTRKLHVAGETFTVPDDAWLAVHLVFKLYWEGVHSYRKGLYAYADLIRLIPRLESEPFERVTAILEKHNLLAAGHYVFRRLPLFGLDLPDHIVHFIEATASPPLTTEPLQANDLGDMWPKLWGRR
jgi:hypothetical protein